MKRRISKDKICLVLVGLALGLLGCAGTESASPQQEIAWTGETQVYLCAEDVQIQVAYFNSNRGDALAALVHEGQLVGMRSLPAASGVRYVDFDEQRGWRWMTKGSEGFLAVLAPDHTAQEEILVKDCQATFPSP